MQKQNTVEAEVPPENPHLYACPNCGHVTDLRTIRTRIAKVMGSFGGRATGPVKSRPLDSETARKLAKAKKRKKRLSLQQRMP